MYLNTMLTGRHFAVFATMAAMSSMPLVCAASKQEGFSMNEAQIRSAVFIDGLSIPCPGEVFVALNEQCHPNWATIVTTATAPVTTDRAQLALAVGVLAANGYIAVEAQDGQQVKNVGREIMSMAKSLGVSQSLMGRGNSLMQFADNNAWDALSDELEATESEVKSSMADHKDRDLIILTSAAAWLRGLEVVSEVVLESDSLHGAEILRQQGLAHQLASQIRSLPDRIKRCLLVPMVVEALDSTALILGNYDLTEQKKRQSLQEIHNKTASLVKKILSSAKELPSPAARNDAQATNGKSSAPEPLPEGIFSNPSPPVPTESHRLVLEDAGSLIKEGYKIRDGDWSGSLTKEWPLFLQVTLFAGEKYRFVGATATKDASLRIAIFNEGGKPVKTEEWKNSGDSVGRWGVGIVPAKSGRYFVGVELINSPSGLPSEFSLVYAYR